MTAQIRRGTAADAGALAEVAAISFPLAAPDDADPANVAAFVAANLSAERFEAYLADAGRVVLVAEDVGVAVGYAMLVLGEPSDPDVLAAVATRPTVDLNKFYVHPDHHGSGVAAALMDATVAEALATGARSLWLGVNNENARANRFYEKHGFEVVGTKRFLLGERLEDDFVRERLL